MSVHSGGRGPGHLSRVSGPSAPVEMVANGTFDSATGWTLGSGWSISGGKAVADGTGSFTDMTQTLAIPLVVGATYRISRTLTMSSGGGAFILGGQNLSGTGLEPTLANVGTKTADVVYTSGSNNVILFESNPFVGSLDDVSIKRIA